MAPLGCLIAPVWRARAIRGTPNERLWQPGRGTDPAPAALRAGVDPRCGRADDLVQSCLLRAVAKQHLWQPGTDLRAWLFTILHNQYVNDVRRSAREGANVQIDDVAPMLSTQSNAFDAVQLRELEVAIAKLPPEQRQVILPVGLEGMPALSR